MPAENVRKFPAVDERVETGAIQFGDDWPGLFIRGDNAMFAAHCLGGVELWAKKNREKVPDFPWLMFAQACSVFSCVNSDVDVRGHRKEAE